MEETLIRAILSIATTTTVTSRDIYKVIILVTHPGRVSCTIASEANWSDEYLARLAFVHVSENVVLSTAIFVVASRIPVVYFFPYSNSSVVTAPCCLLAVFELSRVKTHFFFFFLMVSTLNFETAFQLHSEATSEELSENAG